MISHLDEKKAAKLLLGLRKRSIRHPYFPVSNLKCRCRRRTLQGVCCHETTAFPQRLDIIQCLLPQGLPLAAGQPVELLFFLVSQTQVLHTTPGSTVAGVKPAPQLLGGGRLGIQQPGTQPFLRQSLPWVLQTADAEGEAAEKLDQSSALMERQYGDAAILRRLANTQFAVESSRVRFACHVATFMITVHASLTYS